MRKLSVPIVAALAALLLAGCGGGSAKASTSTSTTTAGDSALSSAFTACLKQQGVTLPGGFRGGGRFRGGSGLRGGTGFRGPGARGGSGPRGGFFGGGSTLSAKQQAAFRACRSKLPNGGRFGGFGNGAGRAALQAYLSCLSDHGVTVPKQTATSPSGSGPAGFASPLRTVRRDPKFAAANKVCAALLPSRGTPAPPA